MLGIFIIMAAVIVVEAAFIWYFITKAVEIIDEYECKIFNMEHAPVEKPVAVNKTAASVKKIWEGEV